MSEIDEIFLVDDDDVDVMAIRRALRRVSNPPKLIVASDGEEALNILSEGRLSKSSVIVLDINMPGDDGLTALRQLRETSNVPVIMLTAAAEVVDRVVGLELGADDYLGKPVDLKELEARIKAVLRRTSAGPDTVRTTRSNKFVKLQQVGTCKLDIDGATVAGDLRDQGAEELIAQARS